MGVNNFAHQAESQADSYVLVFVVLSAAFEAFEPEVMDVPRLLSETYTSTPEYYRTPETDALLRSGLARHTPPTRRRGR